MGMIERLTTPRGELIKITEAGRIELERLYSSLQLVLKAVPLPTITIEGRLFTGLREGAYYMRQRGYRRQFIEKLGFDPYPGTLNLKLETKHDIEARRSLQFYPFIEIKGFSTKTRDFGSVKCYKAIINDEIEGAVVITSRTHYDETTLEVISPINLRKHFKLEDGDIVRVEIQLE
jgi:riboflavin kinase